MNKTKTKKMIVEEEVKILDFSANNNFTFNELTVEQQWEFLSRQSKLFRIKWMLKIPKENREILKKYIKEQNDLINCPKKDFNNENLFEIDNFNFWYFNGKKQALSDINLKIKKGKVTSLIGPSGCGKSTFIKNLNRMNDLIEGVSYNGNIWFGGINIRSNKLTDVELRSKVGMVFQKPTPFEMTIYDNVAFGPKSHGISNRKKIDAIVKDALIDAALWDEIKDDLHTSLGTSLSGGQQQRLCIARAIALSPIAILMDEPTSALDPIATAKIEELILKLSKKVTIIVVTHSMAQAQRISSETIFFYQGKVVESGLTKQIFTKPKMPQTKDYVNGKIG